MDAFGKREGGCKNPVVFDILYGRLENCKICFMATKQFEISKKRGKKNKNRLARATLTGCTPLLYTNQMVFNRFNL